MRCVVQRGALLALAALFGLFTVTAAAPDAQGMRTAAAARQVTPTADADEDGVPDYGDACPKIVGSGSNHGCPEAEPPYVTAANTQRLASGRIELRATCNQPCLVRASGKVGRLSLGRTGTTDYAPTSAPARLRLHLSRAKRAELRAVLRRRTSVSAAITVTATMEGDPQSTRLTIKLTR